MDLEFQIEEGQKIRVERIEIRGNTKTRDTVIRRELAVSPGETFDMVRVKLSKGRLEGLKYFDRVDAHPEPTEVQNARNLVVVVDEGKTGNATAGAGFNTAESLVGYVEYTESNFDITKFPMHPWWQGAGQKVRLRLAIGTQQQDYELGFIEPWFLGRKLQLGVNLYYRDLAYLSPNNLYDEVQAGGKVSLTRALGSDFLRGSVNYTLEDIGINLTGNAIPTTGPFGNVPPAILQQVGYHLLSTAGGSLAYDTRNSVQLSDKGQRTELIGQVTGGPFGGDESFYKLELRSAWFFKGFGRGHVLEVGGRAGVAQAFGGTSDVPFYSRYYLGGMYDLRGFKYRNVSPRQYNNSFSPAIPYQEPVGGDMDGGPSLGAFDVDVFGIERGGKGVPTLGEHGLQDAAAGWIHTEEVSSLVHEDPHAVVHAFVHREPERAAAGLVLQLGLGTQEEEEFDGLGRSLLDGAVQGIATLCVRRVELVLAREECFNSPLVVRGDEVGQVGLRWLGDGHRDRQGLRRWHRHGFGRGVAGGDERHQSDGHEEGHGHSAHPRVSALSFVSLDHQVSPCGRVAWERAAKNDPLYDRRICPALLGDFSTITRRGVRIDCVS